jgi:signal transduction histidine kinase
VDALRHIGELLSGSIARVKQIARGLIPAGLEDRGLTAAVEAMIQSARGSYPVTIDFRASPGFSLADTDRAFQVYRIVQEALSNALKHSGSSHIAVTLGFEDLRRAAETPPAGANEASGGMLVVEVSDSGYGLPERISPDGMGLRIMRYRAEKAGAELSLLRTNPGTRVTCRIPQPAKERK